MRLLHTSDWHLGLRLLTVSLIDEQRAFLGWLGELARAREVDAILVSGDVYDRPIPSVEAVQAFEDALVDLASVCPLVIIAGNHDSATRLGFAAPLLRSAGIHLRSSLDDLERPVVLTDDGAEVLVYGVPYLEPERDRVALGAQKSHEAVLAAAMERVRADAKTRGGGPVVVLAHAFVRGGASSDSERDVSVGGIADAPASVFDGVDYVALGHLHGPQEIDNPGGPVVRYSGSPLAYSFSEEHHVKSVTLVEIADDGVVRVEVVPAPVPRALATVRGDLEDLLADAALETIAGHWVRAILTDAQRPDDAMARLQARFPHALQLEFDPHVDGRPLVLAESWADPADERPADVVAAFVEHVSGAPATAAERQLVEASIERLRIAEASA